MSDNHTTCEVTTLDSTPCGNEIEKRVLTPWGDVRYVCAGCARRYATHAGFVVKPLKDPPPGLVCWCGAEARMRRFDGLIFHLCETHKPLEINILWRRLLQRIRFWWKSLFVRPRLPTAAEIQDLVEAAHARVKRMKERERMPP